jgi:hypothetical protein
MPVIPVLGRKKEDQEFKANLGYLGRLCLKKRNPPVFSLKDLWFCALTFL